MPYSSANTALVDTPFSSVTDFNNLQHGVSTVSNSAAQTKDSTFQSIIEENVGADYYQDQYISDYSTDVDTLSNFGTMSGESNLDTSDDTFASFSEGTVSTLTRASADLPGTSNYFKVDGGSADFQTFEGTIEGWFKFNSISLGRMWGQDDNMEMRFATGAIAFDWMGDNSLGSIKNDWTLNKWYYIAITWSNTSSTLNFYWGDESSQPQFDRGITWNAGPTAYHTENNIMASKGGVQPVDGLISEFRYWDISKSLVDLQAYYNKELSGNEFNLQHYYTFENSLSDIASNSDLDAVGSFTYSSDVPTLSSGYSLDYEVQISNLVTYQPSTITIDTGTIGTELLYIYYWDSEGWKLLFSDLQSDSTYNIAITPPSEYLTLKFKTLFDPADAVQDTYQIDMVQTSSEGQGNWKHMKIIVVDQSYVSEDLTNFPVMISMQDKDLKSYAQTDGSDIAFTDISNNHLYHEISSYNPNYSSTEAELIAWVRTNVSSTEDTIIKMLYGGSSGSGNEAPSLVWQDTYNGVYHFNEDPTGTITDSSNNNNGTSNGMISNNLVNGKVGNSFNFDGNDDYINIGDLDPDLWTGITMSAWISITEFTDARIISTAPTTSVSDSIFGLQAANTIFRTRIGTDGVGGSVSTSLDSSSTLSSTMTWYYLTVTWDASTASVNMYLNGASTNTYGKDGDTLIDSTQVTTIGNVNPIDSRFFKGKIDEVRIGSSAKSSGWISAEYANQNSPGTFITIGNDILLGVEEYVDSVSDVDTSTDIGTHSSTDNQIISGVYDTLTENVPTYNHYTLRGDGNDYVRVGDGTPGWDTATGTISFWMNNFAIGTREMWGAHDLFELQFVSGSRLAADWGTNDAVISTTAFNIDTWYFVAITWDEYLDQVYLYIGTEDSAPVLEDSNLFWSSTVIGLETTNTFLASLGNTYMQGYMDDLRYYNVARTGADIISDFNITLEGNEANLRSYFKLENNYNDDGPAGTNGVWSGNPTFSTNTPAFSNIEAQLDLEMQWHSIPVTDVDVELAIYTGTMDAENLGIDIWYNSAWVNLISDLNTAMWTNISLNSYLDEDIITIRFNDGLDTDDVQSSWQIDLLFLKLTNYKMSWVQEINNIDTNKENYFVSVYGYSSNISESFTIQLWDKVSQIWSPFVTKIQGEQWYNQSISDLDLIDSTMYLRYIGDNEILDTQATELMLDYAGISAYDIIPILTKSQNDYSYEEFSTTNTITTAATDANPAYYEIVRDGSVIYSNTWVSGVDVVYNIDGNSIGSYDYAVVYYDQFGYFIYDNITITVVDTALPVIITSPTDYSYSEGDTGNTIAWKATDANPNTFIIYRDGVSVNSSSWISSELITQNIDGLLKGIYNFTISYLDTSGNARQDTVWVTVTDDTSPILDTQPSDLSYSEGDLNNNITWQASDSYNDSYRVYKNNAIYEIGDWTSGSPTVIDIDGLTKGSYNFTIMFLDESNNYITDTVIVTILDTTDPSISSPADIYYNEGETNNEINWTVSDTYAKNFKIYKNGSLIFGSYWSSGYLAISVDGNFLGVYNYTLIIFDMSGNSNWDTVLVHVSDNLAPTVNTPPDYSYSEGNSNNIIGWIGFDKYESTYLVYINGTVDNSPTSWLSNSPINYNIDGLTKGFYNISVIFYDTSGNYKSDTVFITVTDDTAPTINKPSDFYYAEGSSNNVITWNGVDNYVGTYVVYINGILDNSPTSWDSGVAFDYNIDGLLKGTYNFTIVLSDESGNYVVDTVIITVTDNTNPTITSPPDTGYSEGDSPNVITWTGTDSYAGTYLVYKNGSLDNTATTWNTGVAFDYNIDGLTKGIYNFTIVLSDLSGNNVVDTVIITITDDTPPIVNSPADDSYAEGSTGNTISWSATDNYAATYIVYLEGELDNTATSWISGSTINYVIDDLLKGTYNFTIVFSDESDNIVVDTVIITVTDNTPPVVNSPADDSYDEGSTGNTISWTATDTYNATYLVYIDEVLNNTATPWDSGVAVIYDIDGMLKGTHNVTIVFSDLSGNIVVDTVIIIVGDTTDPIITHPSDFSYSEGDSPNVITWTGTDSYAGTYVVYKNGSLDNSATSWNTGEAFDYNIDGLTKGIYNFTIILSDLSGNSVVDTVIITITDDTDPLISSPNDYSYDMGSTGNTIGWIGTENYPDQYIVYKNGTENNSLTDWTSGVSINYNIDGLSKGLYNFTIIIYDESGNFVKDTVWITVLDATQPYVNNPSNIQYSEGSSSNSINWTIGDLYPDYYRLFIDGTKEGDDVSWTNGTISIDIDGLLVGEYNYTIWIFDASNNSISDTVIITVIDTTLPVVNSPLDITYGEGEINNNITWSATDAYPDYYRVFKDGIQVGVDAAWTSGESIVLDIDGLQKGEYSYVIYYFDASNNTSFDLVVVSVIDNDDPTISTPDDFSYSEGDTGYTISWMGTDSYAGSYIVYKNGSTYSSGSWSSTIAFNVIVDNLPKGIHNMTIILSDSSGNSVVDTVIVTVTDDTDPLVSSPTDKTYSEGDKANTIAWIPQDKYPDSYTVYRNGSIISSGGWISNKAININIDGLALGVYNYTILILDASGNQVIDEVIVSVFDTTDPSISSPADITYAEGSLGNEIIWTGLDIHPFNYTVYQNGSVYATGTWISQGPIEINIDYVTGVTNFLTGDYNFTIIISDTSGNTIADEVIVRVISDSVFLQVPEDLYYVFGTTGNELSWTISDSNPDSYIIYENGTEKTSGAWSNEIPVIYDVDGLSIGWYNYSIWVNDTDGNIITHQLIVTVSDMPLWDSVPTDITDYIEGNTGYSLIWNSTDMFPESYSIFRNGTFVTSGSWDNATEISLNINGLSLGVYEFVIYLNDTVGNEIIDSVFVTVLDQADPTSSSPDDFSYNEGDSNNIITWIPVDLHPDYYYVYLVTNDTQIGTNSTWISGNGITINIDGLTKGEYNFTIYFYDTSNNFVVDIVIVTILDGTDPEVTHPADFSYAEGSNSNRINITATDNYNDYYRVFRNGTQIGGDIPWTSGVEEQIDIDGLAKGLYNFTIYFFDASNNSVFDMLWVTVYDNTAPVVTHPADFSYAEGTTPNTINITATDNYADYYRVFRNGTQVGGDIDWTSGVEEKINIDGLTKGLYNFTIYFFDASNNSVFDMLWVTIYDNTAPVVTHPADFSYAEGTTPNTINITATDNYADYYRVFRNGTQVGGDIDWTSGVEEKINIDGLTKGLYNFTIYFFDASNNSVFDMLWVTVYDNTAPVVTHPADFSYTEGTTLNTINITATDNYENYYRVFRNGTQVGGDIDWISGVEEKINIDGLTKGLYNFTIYFFDASNNSVFDMLWVTIYHNTAPVVTHPIDFSYAEGTTQNTINITGTDNYDNYYRVFRNGTKIGGDIDWTSGVEEKINIDGLTKGLYNFTIYFFDASNNSVFDMLWVTIYDNTAPVVTHPIDFSYVFNTTGHEISWTATDNYDNSYKLFLNGQFNTSGTWISGNPVIIDIDGLEIGLHNYTIYFFDKSNNSVIDTVIITVYDDVLPVVDNPDDIIYSEGSVGNKINITASDSYPNYYRLFINNSLESTDAWESNVVNSINIDGLVKGVYNYTFYFFDTSNNSISQWILVTVLDTTAPLVSQPVDFSYAEGTTQNTINITATDNYADYYRVFRNGTQVGGDIDWTSGVEEKINIDGLAKGLYNFTIYFFDTSNNTEYDIIFVSVIDTTKPVVTTPDDTTISEVSSGNSISWTALDNYASYYEVYINENLNETNIWISGTPVVINTDNLVKGEYNITIAFYDVSGNYRTDTVIIIVVDQTAPVVSQPEDVSYAEGTNSNTISWYANDTYSSYYRLFRNGSKVGNDLSWQNYTAITINVDGLSIGLYNLTIVFFDASNNSATDQVWLTVYDNTNPTISATESSITYVEGSNGNNAIWDVFDLHERNYIIYQNGSNVHSATWISSIDIIYDLDGLSTGDYNFTIIVYDTSANYIVDTVYVHVIDQQNPSINSPFNVYYAEGESNNIISWIGSDLHPDNYTLYLNGTNIDTASWISGVSIDINIDGLSKGIYNYTIVISDESGNTVFDTVIVQVFDETPPSISHLDDIMYEEGTIGNTLSWEAYDLHPELYSIYFEGSLLESGNWTNDNNVTISIDGLLLGFYTYTIYIYDDSGNMVTDTLEVTIYEITSPDILTSPSDLIFIEGDTAVLTWSLLDNYPGTYIIYENHFPLKSGSWLNGNNITYDISHLLKGTHNVSIIIFDTSSNYITHQVLITVVDETNPVISNPANKEISSGSTGNTLSWSVSDNYPDEYQIFLNGTVFNQGAWSNDVPVLIQIDSLKLGINNFTIIAYDLSGNTIIDEVIILVYDVQVPTQVSNSGNYTMIEGSTGNVITWTYTDFNPEDYELLRNGSLIFTQSWTNNKQIVINIDGLEKSIYNYTLVIYDAAGNYHVHSIWIDVIDQTAPTFTVNPATSFNYTEGNTGYVVSWTLRDKYESYYVISLNNQELFTNTWISNVPISINIDGLEAGLYNLSIIVFDASDNSISNNLLFEVFDKTAPSLNSYTSVPEYIEGNVGYTLAWNVFELHPMNYSIYRDDILLINDTWSSDTSIEIGIDGLVYGIYNFTIYLQDESLNWLNHSILISVLDKKLPEIVEYQDDFTIFYNTTGNYITWLAYDLHPSTYIIYLNGLVFQNGQWDNTNNITFNIDGLQVNYYDITLEVFDLANNRNSHSITVRVKDITIIDTIKPEINIKLKVLEGDIETFNGIYLDENGLPVPGAEITMNLFLGSIQGIYSFTTYENGSYTLEFDYSGLLPGVYKWKISFVKEGYLSWVDMEIDVIVVQHSYNMQIDTPQELVQGEEFYITATVLYDNQTIDTLGLGLSTYSSVVGHPAIGVEVTFTIQVEYEDGTISSITKKAVTNNYGVAIVILNAEETSNLLTISSISAGISGSQTNLETLSILPPDDFPEIFSGDPDIIIRIIEAIQNNIIGVFVIIAGLLLVVFLFYRLRKSSEEKMRKVSENVQVAHEELQALQSIRAIIIQTSSKLTVFEQNILSANMSTAIVGGMVSAFSSFLNEIGTSSLFGFEIMERDDVSLTVHKGKLSNFIVISNQKLPFVLLNQIQASQKLVEKTHRTKFTNASRGVTKLKKDEIYPLLNKAGFKIQLTEKLKLNTKNIDRILKERSLSKSLKVYISMLLELPKTNYYNNGVFTIHDLEKFYQSKNVTERVISRSIILSFEFDLLEIHYE
ncbi:MAG: hypothetical protein INQ03_03365 [Candidatus Heimdallarchaeota archaeon]|nr:hypothetical protein [Candidatus Heimdallarchaeota archaeon]